MATQRQHHTGPDDDDDDGSFDMETLDQFDYIRFTLTDMNGIGRSLSVPRRHVDHCLHGGLGFYAGTASCCSNGSDGPHRRRTDRSIVFAR